MSDLMVRGPIIGSSGAPSPLTAGITGGQRVLDAHGRYFDSVMRGNTYVCANQSGVTTQAGLSATTPALTLYNPVGSGVYAEIVFAGCFASVAFAAAAAVWLAANTNLSAAAVTGTAGSVRNALLGAAVGNKVACYTAATLPAAPVAVAALGVGLTGAITTLPALPTLGRFFDGALILYPGAALSFQTSTASGASGFFGEFAWEEIPLLP
jgi:hypothetical protein